MGRTLAPRGRVTGLGARHGPSALSGSESQLRLSVACLQPQLLVNLLLREQRILQGV